MSSRKSSQARTRGLSPTPLSPTGNYYIYDPEARCCHPCTADGEPLVPIRSRRASRPAPSSAQGRAPTSSIESPSTGALLSDTETLPSNAGTLASNAGTLSSNAGTLSSNAGTLSSNAGTLMQMTDNEDQRQATEPGLDVTVAPTSTGTAPERSPVVAKASTDRWKVSQVVPADPSSSVSSYYRSTAMEFDPFPVRLAPRHSSDQVPCRPATVSATNPEPKSRPVEDSRRASLPETITRPVEDDRRASLPATISRPVDDSMIPTRTPETRETLVSPGSAPVSTPETQVSPGRAPVSTPETRVSPGRTPVSTPGTPVSRNRIPNSTPVTPPSRIYTPENPPPRVPNPERSERRRRTLFRPISSGSPSRRVRETSSNLPLPREVTRLKAEGRSRRASTSDRASRPDDCNRTIVSTPEEAARRPDDCNRTIVSERASRPDDCNRTIVSAPEEAAGRPDYCNRTIVSERASRPDDCNRSTVSTPETVTQPTDSDVMIVFASEASSGPVDGNAPTLSNLETVPRPVNSDRTTVSTMETVSRAVLAVHTPEPVRRPIVNDGSTLSTLKTISQKVERRLAQTISESPQFRELQRQATESLREKESTVIMMQMHLRRAEELEGEVESLKKEKMEMQQQRAQRVIELEREVERLRKDKSQITGQYFELLTVVKEHGDNKKWCLEHQLSRCKDLFEQESKCAICFGVIRHALTLECGHSFCKKCFMDWKASRNAQNCSCPICRTPVKVYSPNRMLDSILVGMNQILCQPHILE